MEIPKIDVDHSQLPQIIADMQKGKLQVPRFQREFVWPLSKTRALLDSIYIEFPIGTFFLWRVPGDTPRFFRTLEEIGIPKPHQGAEFSYILDGQQRLTSLFVTIQGSQIGWRRYSWICLDLDTATRFLANADEGFDEDIFVYEKPDNTRYIPVHELVGDNAFAIFEQLKPEWKPAFNHAVNLIKNYPFSVVWIQNQSTGDAIEIFQRINQGGARLSRFDLVCANVWREDFDFRAQVEEENKRFKSRGFGELNETIFTQAFALILRSKCTTLDELSLETDQIKKSWPRVINALRQAVDFASNNLGVKRYDFLPYRGILAVLAWSFYYYPIPSHKQQAVLWKWFWQVTLSERYSSTSPTRMQEDIQRIKKSFASDGKPFAYPVHVTAEAVASTKMSTNASALRNATLCLLALKGPRSFKNNGSINVRDDFFSDLAKAERHHVFPVAYLKSKGISTSHVHFLPNFCFIPSDLNKEIGKKEPSQYLSDYRAENHGLLDTLASHLIPCTEDSPLWKDDFEGFIAARAELIADELNRMAGSSPEMVAPQKNPLEYRLDIIEDELRELIHSQFDSAMDGGYWKKVIPGDVQDVVDRKVSIYINQNPQEENKIRGSDQEKLKFCDFSDYEKIITKNWETFKSFFLSQSEFQKHSIALRNFRNSFKHIRPAPEIERKNGEAAILWMEGCLQKIPAGNQEIEDGEES